MAAYEALPTGDRKIIEVSLGGPPALFAGFVPGLPPRQWRRIIPPLLTVLVQRAQAVAEEDRLREGEVPVWNIRALRDLTDLRIQRSSGRPYFGVLEMTEVVDSTQRLLEKKFARSYQTGAPIELLAYYFAAPTPDDVSWRAGLREAPPGRRARLPLRQLAPIAVQAGMVLPRFRAIGRLGASAGSAK